MSYEYSLQEIRGLITALEKRVEKLEFGAVPFPHPHVVEDSFCFTLAEVAQHKEAAIREERQRCVKLAEDFAASALGCYSKTALFDLGKRLVAAIRDHQ